MKRTRGLRSAVTSPNPTAEAAVPSGDGSAPPPGTPGPATEALVPPPAFDEFLPGTSVARADVRHARERRRRILTAAAVGAAVLVVGAVIWAVSGDDGSGDRAAVTPAPSVSTSRSTSTTTTEPAPDSTSTTSGSTAEIPPPDTATSLPAGPDPAPDTGGGGPTGFTVAIDAGSCRWDADAGELVATGSVTAGTGEDSGAADVTVAWSDASGDLDSWDELVPVDAGRTERFDISTPWDEAPQGALDCQVTLS